MADLTKEDLWEVARRFFPESVKFMDRTRDFLQGYQGEIRQQVTARALYAFLKKDGFFKAIGDTPMSYTSPAGWTEILKIVGRSIAPQPLLKRIERNVMLRRTINAAYSMAFQNANLQMCEAL